MHPTAITKLIVKFSKDSISFHVLNKLYVWGCENRTKLCFLLGKNAYCPVARPLAGSAPCAGGSMTCLAGACAGQYNPVLEAA
jgi:hypothetical protein